MSPLDRRPARLTALTALAVCPAFLLVAACGSGGSEVSAAPAVVAADATPNTTASSTAAAAAPRPRVSPSGTGGASPSGPARATRPAPTPVASPTAAPRAATALPKGAVVVGSGRARTCTAAALRSAVARVVKRGSGTVSFDCGASPATIALDRPLAFTGGATSRFVLDGRGLVTLDGRDRTGLVTLDGRPGVSYTFRGLTFTRGRTTERGAAIHGGWRNRLLVEDCTFTSNAVTPSSDGEAGGGAIYAHEGSATVRRSTFRGNTARLGGAIMSTITDVVVESSTFIGNRAAYAGGAIYADAGVLIVRGSTVSGNRATYQAGGIWMWHPDPRTARIEKSTISGNRVTGSGTNGGMAAGIHNGSGPLLITDSTISGNVASYLGGGVFNYKAVTTIRRTRFVGNKAKHAGGALFNGGGSIVTTGCTFRGNTPRDVR